MNIKRQIPNLITLGNLFCGTLAILFAVKGNFTMTALLVAIGIICDFFDGFVARRLNVQGELGKQLDSLADMVTSGVVPGIVMVQLLIISLDTDAIGYFGIGEYDLEHSYLPYFGIVLTLGAGYRLAKFNIDTRQTNSFIGLPTPAMNLFVVSLPLIITYGTQEFFINLVLNKYVLIGITVLLTFLMNAELPLFSLKFKGFDLKKNWIKYVFLCLAVVMLITLKTVAFPLIIIVYVLLSIVNTLMEKSSSDDIKVAHNQ